MPGLSGPSLERARLAVMHQVALLNEVRHPPVGYHDLPSDARHRGAAAAVDAILTWHEPLTGGLQVARLLAAIPQASRDRAHRWLDVVAAPRDERLAWLTQAQRWRLAALVGDWADNR